MTQDRALSAGAFLIALIAAAIALLKGAPAAPGHSQAIDISTIAPQRCSVTPQYSILRANEDVFWHADDQNVYYVYPNATACGSTGSAIKVDPSTNNGNSSYYSPTANVPFVVCDNSNQLCSGGGTADPNIGVRIRP